MNATFIDAVGAAHAPASADARIVSLVPSITELICDLGLADQLVGRTKWCIHPESVVDRIPAIGGTKKANLDKLRALAPTHVVLNIDENTKEMAEAIGEFVPNVVVTHPNGPLDNLELYRLIGGIFDREDQAETLCDRFEAAYAELAEFAAKLPERRVLYLIWKDPWMTVAPDTYIARTLELVRWRSDEVGVGRYPEVAIDSALLKSLDLVLFSSEPFAFTDGHLRSFADEYGCDPAKLHLIDGEMTSWYGSRAIQALRYLGEFVLRIGTE